MVDTSYTEVTHVEQNQSQKEVTVNAALDSLSAFMAATLVFNSVAADVTPTATDPGDQWFSAFRFVLNGTPGAPISFFCPTGATFARPFMLVNNLDDDVTVVVAGGSADLNVVVGNSSAGNTVFLYTDGTDVTLIA